MENKAFSEQVKTARTGAESDWLTVACGPNGFEYMKVIFLKRIFLNLVMCFLFIVLCF